MTIISISDIITEKAQQELHTKIDDVLAFLAVDTYNGIVIPENFEITESVSVTRAELKAILNDALYASSEDPFVTAAHAAFVEKVEGLDAFVLPPTPEA